MLGCKTNKNLIAVEHLNPHEESDKFITKLKKEGVDTIITYADACSGCIQGVPVSYYVYWVNNSSGYITKFNKYSNYNTVSHLVLNFDFVTKVLDSLKNEILIEPTIELLHYRYEKIEIILKNKEVKFDVNEFYKTTENELKYRIIFIDKFRSFLFVIDDYNWKALNYKFKDKKL